MVLASSKEAGAEEPVDPGIQGPGSRSRRGKVAGGALACAGIALMGGGWPVLGDAIAIGGVAWVLAAVFW